MIRISTRGNLNMRTMLILAGAVASALAFSQVTPQNGDWPVYGHDPGGARHSPLTQINTTNVSRLQRAWTYHTGEQGRSFEATPIFVDNVLYLPTQNQNIVALDPETGNRDLEVHQPFPECCREPWRCLLAGRPADTAPDLVWHRGWPADRTRREDRNTRGRIWRQRHRQPACRGDG